MRTSISTTLSLLFCLSATQLAAQTESFEWAFNFGSTGNDIGRAITTDTNGNVYTCGGFSETVDLDPGPGFSSFTSNGVGDIFVQKLDGNGSFIWARHVGGSNFDACYDIALDQQQHIYVIGEFMETVDFDPGPGTTSFTSSGSRDAFVLKLDTNGDLLWARQFGSSGLDGTAAVEVDITGNVYVSGVFRGTVDFDPGPGTANLSSNGGADIFLVKLSPEGDLIWAKQIGGPDDDFPGDLAADNAQNIYHSGIFESTADLDPGAGTSNFTSNGIWDMFIQKFDTSGNLTWVKRVGGPSYETPYSMVVDGNGNVNITGSFFASADFDPNAGTTTLTSSGSSDIFVQQLDSNGDFSWAIQLGGTDADYAFGLDVDFQDNLYFTGFFEGSADFDPGSGIAGFASLGDQDIFVEKLDNAGNFQWVKRMGSNDTDVGEDITTDALGNIYTTGYFQQFVDFDPGNGTGNLTSNGLYDAFIQKLTQQSFTTDSQVACYTYTWIDGTTYTASNDTATYTLTNFAGYDSTVTLDLTINRVTDVLVIVDGNRLTANNVAASSYQWVDCDNGFSPISGATNQSFTATKSGNYAVVLTENGCIDTSACEVITNVSIEENSFESSLSVFPNPTRGQLSIDLGDSYSELTVVVRNAIGQELQRRTYGTANQLNLILEGKPGMYFVELTAPDRKAVFRVVKE